MTKYTFTLNSPALSGGQCCPSFRAPSGRGLPKLNQAQGHAFTHSRVGMIKGSRVPSNAALARRAFTVRDVVTQENNNWQFTC